MTHSMTATLAQSKPASKAEQRFRKLVAQIERARERLKEWESYSLRYNQRLSAELMPLQEKLRDTRKQLALLIDELLSVPARGRRPGKVQRSKLRQLLLQLVEDLLQDADDEALNALRDKYESPDDEEDRLAQVELTRSFLQGVTGLEIDEDHGARTPEELMDYVERTMHEQPGSEHDKAAREVSQSLRDVFRKLVSALHPDREPDAAERERKNELMQRVNRAYEANDLLTLLGLQLEIEQIDSTHWSSIPPQRLAHYTQILREQLANLEAELARFVQPFLMAMGQPDGRNLTPAAVDRQLSADIAQMKTDLRGLKQDLVAFRDPEQLRRLLADYEPDAPAPVEAMEMLADLMRDFQNEIQPPRRGRRRRR